MCNGLEDRREGGGRGGVYWSEVAVRLLCRSRWHQKKGGGGVYVSVLGNLTGIAYCEEGENTVYVYILCNGLEDRRKKRGGGVYVSEVAERLMCIKKRHTI